MRPRRAVQCHPEPFLSAAIPACLPRRPVRSDAQTLRPASPLKPVPASREREGARTEHQPAYSSSRPTTPSPSHPSNSPVSISHTGLCDLYLCATRDDDAAARTVVSACCRPSRAHPTACAVHNKTRLSPVPPTPSPRPTAQQTLAHALPGAPQACHGSAPRPRFSYASIPTW